MSFASRWDKKEEEDSKVSGPIKPRIEIAQKRLQMQISALDSILQRLKSKDETIFKKIINALQRRDTQYSIILSNELAQIRKTMKMVSRSKLALEQVNLRLNTITELGDVVVTLSPAMAVVKNVRAGLSSMMPEVDNEMSEISNVLANILIDAGQVGGYTINFDTANEEAAKILEEAAAVAENSIEERLPDVTNVHERRIASNEQ